MKIFGLPVQFVTVAVVSLTLTIYLMAAVADARVESRVDDIAFAFNRPETGSQANLPQFTQKHGATAPQNESIEAGKRPGKAHFYSPAHFIDVYRGI